MTKYDFVQQTAAREYVRHSTHDSLQCARSQMYVMYARRGGVLLRTHTYLDDGGSLIEHYVWEYDLKDAGGKVSICDFVILEPHTLEAK